MKEEIKNNEQTNEEQEVRQEHEGHHKHDHRRGKGKKKNFMDGAKKVGKKVVTALTVVGGITVLGLIGMAVATAGQNKKKNKYVQENDLYLVAENADEDDRKEKDDDPFKSLEKQMETSETK